MTRKAAVHRRRLEVTGQVQGVGFRPYVHRLAGELGLTGWVMNGPAGVVVEVQGPADRLEAFCGRLSAEAPPLAQIAECRAGPADVVKAEKGFEIRPSEGGELTDAQVTVDVATCPQCLAELADESDPRYEYPFINCTNCGPRYTIVRRIPYDRPNTTMAEFAMCGLCGREYSDPACRRFHAQPIACPACGPSVWLVDTHGRQIQCDQPIRRAAEMLLAGKIVAVKGLGGFHLACRADKEHVVRRLRRRKGRDAKPFALMVADIERARELCELTPQAELLLTGPLRPIVLAKARPAAKLAASVADGLDTLGVMLPYTPLHHLLFAQGLGPVVMTSGNYSDEPLAKDNAQAIGHLGRIADALLVHNRRIERRIDDSVVQAEPTGRTQVLRRGRGYAPQPISLPVPGRQLPPDGPAILAVGAELKNTVCLVRGGRAVLGEHIGDLTDGRTYRHFIDTINHLEDLFEIRPELLAADLHPLYLSSQYALKRHRGELAARPAVPIVRVQHHHAHVAACLADNGQAGPAIGLVCDGVGYGDDGAVWGCEVLRAETADYERLGHLAYLPLIGADAAALETHRPAVAALHAAFGRKCEEFFDRLPLAASRTQLLAALSVLAAGVNCPRSSSLGRWFDAVACLCGLAAANRFEGEAPMRLEAAIAPGVTDAYGYRMDAAEPFTIDLAPAVEGIVFDLCGGVDTGVVAAKFHNTVVRFLAAAARRARETTGLEVVALSGGCFANRYLTAGLMDGLQAEGFEVLTHRTVPCNDGGVSLGQAVVAAARSRTRASRGACRVDESRED